MQIENPTLIYVIFFVTSIAYPLWVSNYAGKRGRAGWSKIAFFSIMVGLGFFGGTAALAAILLKPGSNLVESTKQKDIPARDISRSEKTNASKSRGICPKCNSNLTRRIVKIQDPVSGERIIALNQDRVGKTAGSIMAVIGILVIFYTLYLFFSRDNQIGYLAAAGAGGYFVYLGARPWLGERQERAKQVLETFTCSRCHHTWDGIKISDKQ